MRSRRRSPLRRLGIGVSITTGLLLILLYAWAVIPFTVMDEAREVLEDQSYEITRHRKYISIRQPGSTPSQGIILYPGARVDSEAYAPLARIFADAGWLAVLVQMPLDLAVLGKDRALVVIDEHRQVDSWYIGGHSLGGAMAASFANEHPELLTGLYLLGSYSPDSVSLAQSGLSVISIAAQYDLFAQREEIAAAAGNLPSDTLYRTIEGGNHARFGWYGPQNGDGIATISHQEQTEQTARLMLELWK